MRFVLSFSLVLLFSMSGLSQSRSSSSADSDFTTCPTDVRWLNTNGSVNHPRSSEAPVYLSFLAHLSKGDGCSSAEVTFTATYLTESQDFICAGTIRNAMNVSSQVQGFNISVRPFIQLDFLRWRNEPGARGEQAGKRLTCLNIDGTSDVGDAERQKAGWMRVSVGVISAKGGLAVTEAIFRFVP
jgi:hypothetical protein